MALSFATIRFFAVIRHTVKVPALVALPTVVSKAQEGEGLWFSLSPRFPVASGEPPELDQSSLIRM
jgi:hypothetical protein